MMRRSWICIALLALVVAMFGCRRRRMPEGIPIKYVDALTAMADEGVGHCDRWLWDRNCYQVDSEPGDRHADPGKAIPMPTTSLNGARELRYLWAYCWAANDQPEGKGGRCDTERLERTPKSKACRDSEFKNFDGWQNISPEGEGISVGVPADSACKQPWVGVEVIRKNQAGDRFSIVAHFLPRKWLDEHPEDAKDAKK
jgi:hypothetical protein